MQGLGVLVFAIFFSIVLATNAENTADLERLLERVSQRRQEINQLRNLLSSLDDSYSTIQKRTCLMNAGLSHSCDYSEMSKAGDQLRYLTSGLSPGRRRRDTEWQLRHLQEKLFGKNS